MSLLFNMLSRLVIIFLPRSKHLLISWLQSPSAVILEPKKVKSATVSTVSPSLYHEVMGLDAMILVFWNSVLVSNSRQSGMCFLSILSACFRAHNTAVISFLFLPLHWKLLRAGLGISFLRLQHCVTEWHIHAYFYTHA